MLDKRKVMEGIIYVLRTGCLKMQLVKNTVQPAAFLNTFRNAAGRRIRNNNTARNHLLEKPPYPLPSPAWHKLF
ncbi:MAG: hypothetical protein ACRDBM_05170 [Sporomusa sp.]